MTIAFGALSVAALTTFAVAGLSAEAKYSRLEDCRPRCDPNDVDQARSTYLVGDVALGIGIVSLGVAVGAYLLQPRGTVASISDDHRHSGFGTRIPSGPGR